MAVETAVELIIYYVSSLCSLIREHLPDRHGLAPYRPKLSGRGVQTLYFHHLPQLLTAAGSAPLIRQHYPGLEEIAKAFIGLQSAFREDQAPEWELAIHTFWVLRNTKLFQWRDGQKPKSGQIPPKLEFWPVDHALLDRLEQNVALGWQQRIERQRSNPEDLEDDNPRRRKRSGTPKGQTGRPPDYPLKVQNYALELRRESPNLTVAQIRAKCLKKFDRDDMPRSTDAFRVWMKRGEARSDLAQKNRAK
jgi:hypothetical protein